MPPQHENCDCGTTSTSSMISPASMSSELNVAMKHTTSQNRNGLNSSTWQNDLVFLEDLKDVLTFLKLQEASYEKRKIRKQIEWQQKTSGTNDRKFTNLPPFHDSWRPVMVSWMYHVADTFRLMPIVVATGVYILDICAWDLCDPSSRKYKQKELYPLMTMTALNMAVKCHETKMFPLEQLVRLFGAGDGSNSGRCYTPDDVITMEARLLNRCGWKLHCPTVHDYLLRFVTILGEQYQAAVTSSAVTHLKHSLLWEHVLHQNKKEQGVFSKCTTAYAAFLMAMEEVGLPLTDKQAACLALLEVANLSANTPRLSEAYNWLYEAKSLQMRLEKGNNNLCIDTSAIASTKSVPSHASPQRIEDDAASTSDEMSCDTAQLQQAASSSVVAIVEQDSDDEAGVTDDQSTSIMSYESTITSDNSVIFCSYSTDGDAVEVVATDTILDKNDEDVRDDDSMDHSATLTVLPTVAEEEEALACNPAIITVDDCEEDESVDDESKNLVLSESIDEDGFEIAFGGKHSDPLMTNVTSPRDVAIDL
eukprot:CAMPEP_0197192970 /NCGR_PEP_ID=MMETSP1423-20130617/26162_1 /TAXON_ID=476441 /ORGANISM="Pseudo-nitzschia heimii, Strain UNC1101" /LENGTH=534 /DNA_ID=CAMNT_0042646007 /DNA_START=312 /DNA_END=1916 /DNA_ORIENTATION=-